MSIKKTFNGATLIRPGAFSKIVVENLSGFPLTPTGVVGIIGEAIGGEPGTLDVLSGPGIQDAKSRYKSGPIADALELLVNPSKDPRIVNGASTIVVYKTNAGLQSALDLNNSAAVAQVHMTSKNWGADENNLNAQVSVGSIVDVDAKIVGSIAGPYTLAGGETLILKINSVIYTYTGTLTGSQTASALVGDMNTGGNWAPSKPIVASATLAGGIQIVIDTAALTSAKKDYGYIAVDATSTLDTIIGMSGSARGLKGSRFLALKKGVASELSPELGGVDVLSILYTGAGTACALSVQKTGGQLVLSTACAGAASDDLSLVLVDAQGVNKFTVKELVDQINAKGVYTAVVLYPNPSLNASELDFYSAMDVKNVAGVLRRDIADLVAWAQTFSQLAGAAKLDNVSGAVATMGAPAFFTGAADGSSLNSDYAAGFEAMKEMKIDIIVPLISEDIGSVTIDSINALAVSHALWAWSTEGKSERELFCSKSGSKTVLKSAAKTSGSGMVSMLGQRVRVLDKNSNLVWMKPWAAACIAAGMRAGAEVGEPLTYKLINVIDVDVEDGSWSPKKDFAEMLDAGVMIIEPLDKGGFRIMLGNTTYGVDANFVWNRESVVQAAGYVAYDLRYNLEAVFTGTKARTGTAEAMANFIKTRMSTYLDADIIVGDDLNKGLGYTKLSVQIQGNTAIINVSITPVQGIDFILPTIYLADIRQSA